VRYRSARRVLCGGRGEILVPTATSYTGTRVPGCGRCLGFPRLEAPANMQTITTIGLDIAKSGLPGSA